MLDRLKSRARVIKTDVRALYRASRDPRLPWYVKMLAIAVAAYAVSPIDLIPDFIPVLGYLDDVLLVPLGIIVVIRLIPPEIMTEHRSASECAPDQPVNRAVVIVIVTIWAVSLALIGWFAYQQFAG